MKTSGTTDPVLPLTKKQKCACNIVMGVLLLIAGVILVLAGTDVINAAVGEIAAPTVLFAFGTAVTVSAVIAKNSLSMWFAGVVLTCGLTSLLAVVTEYGYSQFYPLYVAAPGIGCLFSVWFAEAKFPQIKTILFFVILGGLLMLGSFGVCGMGLCGGLVAAFGGLCVILFAVETYLLKDKSNNA